MKQIKKMNISKMQNQAILILFVILGSLVISGCSKDKISNPPVMKIFANNVDVTSDGNIVVPAGARLEYRFEISAFATITNLKTVISDISVPTVKKSKEILVGGLTNSLNEIVKGVIFVSVNTEIMLVVKDIDGNEVRKLLTVSIQ